MHILVAVMNWGLGHATRCIPIIYTAQSLGHTITVCSDGAALALLRQECKDVDFYELPSYNIRYYKNMTVGMALQGPKMLQVRPAEHAALHKIIKDKKIDLIISDQRYGCYSSDIRSVFITHQVHLPLKGLQKAAGQKLHDYWMQSFDEIWIPDTSGDHRLAGDMSAPHNSISTNYLGVISRLSEVEEVMLLDNYQKAFILSGPEPNRSRLEQDIRTAHRAGDERILLVRGVIKDNAVPDQICDRDGRIDVMDYATSAMVKTIIHQVPKLYSRSGYTSLMDYAVLGKCAYLIPTEGQPEQLYLAEYAARQGWHQHIQTISDTGQKDNVVQPLMIYSDLSERLKELISS